ncbi:hypothetical protein F2Q68_00045017 [Brassica cretica]|uniref:Guanylate kinase 1 n=1 Tax=Brassica cretica TaxID=69181 RepID=A0A8S9LN65_BRACR|nr:hypothetical protein F2Q68_00045017 [Brassica cretica]
MSHYKKTIESVEVVTDSGKRCILDIDVQGARSVKASSLDAIFIFVCPPSMKELEDRLRARGTETEEQIQKRLRNAEAEIKAGESSGIFEHILYNDKLEECYKNLKNLLGINDVSPVNGVEVEGISLPKEHTVTKVEDKILIQETGEATKNNMIVLDLSSINGGAPGRTRGIILDTVNSTSLSSPLGKEVVAWSKGVRGNAEKPIVISGPSGVGKGTLIAMLMQEFPSMFGFSVSHTTRSPRCMEENGVHYHFTDKTVMDKEINDGKFLEFASVHGNLYGTSIESVEVVTDSGKRCILDIDVQGARSVKASSLDAIFIFVCPPSMKELEVRLRARGTETEEQIQKRLRNAEAEIKAGESSGIFEHILYNDNLEECYKNLKNLLGINDESPVNGVEVEGISLPKEHTVTKVEDKILIQETVEATKNNMIVLDLSSINGGAPGRTRGIILDTVNSS